MCGTDTHTICIYLNALSIVLLYVVVVRLEQIYYFRCERKFYNSLTCVSCLEFKILNYNLALLVFFVFERKKIVAEAHTHVSESTRFCRLSKNHMNSLFSPFVRFVRAQHIYTRIFGEQQQPQQLQPATRPSYRALCSRRDEKREEKKRKFISTIREARYKKTQYTHANAMQSQRNTTKFTRKEEKKNKL